MAGEVLRISGSAIKPPLRQAPKRWQQYFNNRMMVKSNAKKALPIILITLFCVAVNLYWLFHQDKSATFFVQVNLLTACTLIFVIHIPAIKQKFKNGDQK